MVPLTSSPSRGVRAQDEHTQGRDQRAVLAGELGQFRPSGDNDAHRVIGEVRGFDHPGPWAGLEGGEDVLAVLLVLVAARLSGRAGDCGDQGCGAGAEPPGQRAAIFRARWWAPGMPD